MNSISGLPAQCRTFVKPGQNSRMKNILLSNAITNYIIEALAYLLILNPCFSLNKNPGYQHGGPRRLYQPAGAKVNAYGIGGGLMRHFNEKCGLSFDALLYFGGKQETTMTADANNSFISPSTFDVPVTRKFILYSGAFSFRYYLVGDCEDEQGLYGYIGIGATKGRVKNASVGSYDHTLYHLDNGSEGNVDGLEGFTANSYFPAERTVKR
jgi:hypothetical protein